MSPHGTAARRRAGCSCPACHAAYRTYMAAFEGTRRPYTRPAHEAREHLAKLAEAGIGQRAAAKLSGLSYSTIRDVSKGRQRRCRVTTIEAILAVPLDAQTPGKRVDKTPAVALVQRLAEAGVQRQEIAVVLHSSTRNLDFLTARRKTITARTWQRLLVVAQLYVRAGRVPATVLEGVGQCG